MPPTAAYAIDAHRAQADSVFTETDRCSADKAVPTISLSAEGFAVVPLYTELLGICTSRHRKMGDRSRLDFGIVASSQM